MTYTQEPPASTKKMPKRGRGRPRKNDIMNLQRSISTTPEELAKVILNTPPHKVKI